MYIFHEPLTDDHLCDKCFQQMKFSLQPCGNLREGQQTEIFISCLDRNGVSMGPQRRAINLAALKVKCKSSLLWLITEGKIFLRSSFIAPVNNFITHRPVPGLVPSTILSHLMSFFFFWNHK